MTYFALIALMLGASAGDINYETARLERRIEAIQISEPITVDGKLNEPAWSDAPTAGNFIQAEPREGEPSVEDTEVRILYDKENLYLGVYAHDSKVGKLVISDLKKD